MYKENFIATLHKAEATLQSWAHRSLSIPGKITVVNLLIASLFVHKLMCLPTPPHSFFMEFKKLITKFLWDGKPPRIRYVKLIQPYERGGLKLVDLEAKNHALKATWIFRWLGKNRLNEINWLYLNTPIKDQRIWKCNIKEKDLDEYFVDSKDVTISILKSWSKFQFTTAFSTENFFTTPLYMNSLVRKANRPYLEKKLIDSNINSLSNIWNWQSKTYYTYQELVDEQGDVISFLLYNSLVSSIPTLWKQKAKLIQVDNDETEGILDRTLKLQNPAKLYYWTYIERTYEYVDVAAKLWARDLGLDEESVQLAWERYLQLSRPISQATKLRWLQYRILNRAITTNIKRTKWDKNVTDKCTFCKRERETTLHVFVECELVKKLWKSLIKWVKYMYSLEISLTDQIIIFNDCEVKGQKKKFINTLILIMKQFIYASKCKEQIPIFVNFVEILDYWYRMERIAAWNNDYYDKFVTKWKLYKR